MRGGDRAGWWWVRPTVQNIEREGDPLSFKSMSGATWVTVARGAEMDHKGQQSMEKQGPRCRVVWDQVGPKAR